MGTVFSPIQSIDLDSDFPKAYSEHVRLLPKICFHTKINSNTEVGKSVFDGVYAFALQD